MDRLLPITVAVPVFDVSDKPFLKDEMELVGFPVVGLEGPCGGSGNEAILIVFRRAFSGPPPLAFPIEEADRNVGTAGVEADCCGVGKAEGRSGFEGERSLVGLPFAESP